MKKILIGLALLFSLVALPADVKISQLPLGVGTGIGVNDSFPYVQNIGLTTKRLTIFDLVNVPAFTSKYATLLSPTFTGIPLAPTAPALTSTTQIATTAFCTSAINVINTIPTLSFKGRLTAGTGAVENLTATQATSILNVFQGDTGSGGLKGLVPSPAAGDAAANKFLKADGTWAVVSGPTPTPTPTPTTGPTPTPTPSPTPPIPVWGTITGTLANQIDLQTILSIKAPLLSPTFSGTIYLAPQARIKTSGTAPVGVPQAGLGTGGALCTVTGTDVAGIITLDAGTAAFSTGNQCNVTFDTPYVTDAPVCIISNRDNQNFVDSMGFYSQETTTTLFISSNGAPTSSSTYVLGYHCIQID
jgi:type V secretory pathway adhesin AidA